MDMTAEQIFDFVVDAEQGGDGWFRYGDIPTDYGMVGTVVEIDEDGDTVDDFQYTLEYVYTQIGQYVKGTSYDSVEEFMECYDAGDADNVMQKLFFGEYRYS